MLASTVLFQFPALILSNEDHFYGEALSADDLFLHDHLHAPRLLGWEIVDSAGQRFLVRALVDVQPVERSGWRRRLGVIKTTSRYRCDLDLERLPPASFDETLRRVIGMEAAQEAYHVSEGGGPDSAEFKERLRRCLSIAEIIKHRNAATPDSPRGVVASIVADLKDWWRGISKR